MTDLRIAVVDKCANRVNYSKHFGFPVETLHMSSNKVQRLKVADIDLDVNFADYDYVILIGSEAVKRYSKVSAVANYTGKLVAPNEKHGQLYEKFIVSISPAMLFIKPEMQPVFDKTVKDIVNIINGTTKPKAPVDYRPIQSTAVCNEYLRYILSLPVEDFPTFALDTETTALYARKGYLLGVSISHKTHQGVYIDANYMDEESYKLMQFIIDTPKRNIVLHNCKFDLHILCYHLGLDFTKAHEEKRLHDTMVMHYVLDERQGTHGLKKLAMHFTDMGDYDYELDNFKKLYCKEHKMKQEDFTYDLIPFDTMWPYAAGDTDATLRLFNKFWPILQKNHKLLWLYENVMMPTTVFLYKVEERGLPVSVTRLQKAHEYLQLKLFHLEEQLYKYPEVIKCEQQLDKKFNPNSTQQLRHLLFDVLNLPPTGKLTDSGAISTDAEVLQKLSDIHEIPKLILEIRKTSKLISSFITKLLDNVDMDGCIRTNFGCTTTTSGRLSSSGTFNAQQLPRDNPIIKGCIVAPKGYKVIAKDLTTAEVYYAAVLSGDKMLQQVFINMTNEPEKYADFHSTIAHMVFQLPCEPNEVKKKYPAMRQASKAITFGILYGSGAASVAESINIALLEQSLATGEPFVPCTVEDAKGHINTYFKRFKQLKKWIDKSHNQIRQSGFIYNFYGRKRRLRNYQSPDKGVVAGEVRSGFNAIIQGGSSDSFVLSAISADKEILERGLDVKIIGLVHDSIIAIVREDLVDIYHELINRHVHSKKYNWDIANGAFEIPGCPIGLESDSEEGGSRDYSCGKMDKAYPFISVYDSPEMQNKAKEVLNKYINNGMDYILELCPELDNYLEGDTTDMTIINKVMKKNKLKGDAKALAILTHKDLVLESLHELSIEI